MASNYDVNGVDLDSIFAAYVTGQSQAAATGYEVGGVDIATRYAELIYGTSAALTHMTVGGADLNTIFAKIGTLAPLAKVLFSGGSTNGAASTATKDVSLYDIYAHTSAAGTALNYIHGAAYISGSGNSTKGIIGGGTDTANTSLLGIQMYTYTSGTWAAGTLSSATVWEFAGCSSTSTILLWAAGTNISTTRQIINTKFTYSNSTGVLASSLGTAVAYMAAFSNGTYGYYTGGSNNSASNTTHYRYTFSSDAWGGVTALPTAMDNTPAAFGNTAYGIWAGGANSGGGIISTAEKYTISSNAWAAATALGTAREYTVGHAGGNTTGFVGGGSTTGTNAVATVDVYTISTGTRAAGSNLTYAVCQEASSGWGAY